MRIIAKVTVLLVSIYFVNSGTARSDWQTTLEQHFDIVSTFDELDDWVGMAPDRAHGGYGNVGDPQYMPRKANGENSVWSYYSYWGVVAPENRSEKWIKDFGNNPAGGKSCAIRMVAPFGDPPIAASRMGIYFGTPGDPETGYSDVYIFYRVNIPRQMWITEKVPLDGQIVADYAGNYEGRYVEGDKYIWWASWKFFNINTGFVGPWAWHDGPLEGDRRYGDTEILQHLKLFDGTNVIHHFETQWQTEMWWADDTTRAFPDGQWAAVEYHYILEEPAYTGQNGTVEVWIYDEGGNAAKVMERHDVRYRSNEFVCSNGINNHKFNSIVIGGNNSDTYSCGQGMNCTYYIDDVVIDNQRIGPDYFQLLASANETGTPAPPSNLRLAE